MNNEVNEQNIVVQDNVSNNGSMDLNQPVAMESAGTIPITESQENIPEEKKKSSKLPILIVLLLLIILLLGVGYFYFFRKNNLNPKDVFVMGIDKANNYALSTIDAFDKNINSASKTSNKMTFDINTDDPSFTAVKNILNKFELNFDSEVDYNNKIMNINLGAKYNSKELLSTKLSIDNNVSYIDLGYLLNKVIKADLTGFEDVWEIKDLNSYKTIVNEVTKIIKNNLKDSYFSNEKNVYKMEIKQDELKIFISNIIEEIKTNDNIMNILVDLMKSNRSEIETQLDKYKNEFNVNSALVIEVTLNKINEVEKLSIGESNKVVFEKNNEKYNVLVIENGNSNNIGTLTINNDYFEIRFNVEESTIEIKFDNRFNKKDYLINISNNCTNSLDESCISGSVSLSLKESENKGDITLNVVISEFNTTVIVSDKYEITENAIVSKPTYDNAVKIDSLNDSDMDAIYKNLLNNEGVQEVIKDLGLDYLIEEIKVQTALESACSSAGSNLYSFNGNGFSINCENGRCNYTNANNETTTKYCM